MTQVIDVEILTETLKSIPAIVTLVDWNGQAKIFWEHVPQDVPLPYIVMTQMMGGDDNSAQSKATDTCWKIVAHTGDMSATKSFANGIYKLAGLLPVVPTALASVAIGYTTIEEESPVFDRFPVQNIPVFVVGGIYRLRLSILE